MLLPVITILEEGDDLFSLQNESLPHKKKKKSTTEFS